VVSWFVDHDVVGLLASYYYASAHYVVTAIVLLWLYRRRASRYPRARQTLVASTNQLAAFPSMHAGWALWVALAITAATASRALTPIAARRESAPGASLSRSRRGDMTCRKVP
jgi:hypothetical protein